MALAAEWMRIAFVQFLSAEAKALMGIRDLGECQERPKAR